MPMKHPNYVREEADLIKMMRNYCIEDRGKSMLFNKVKT